MLPQHAARQPLRYVELRHDVIDAAATASGACISHLPASLRVARLEANGSPGGAGVIEPASECGGPFPILSESPDSHWGRTASPNSQARAAERWLGESGQGR